MSIFTNGKDLITKEILEVPAGSGGGHYRMVQETLARLDLKLEPQPFQPLLLEKLGKLTGNEYVILISYNQKEELQQMMLSCKQAKREYAWIIPTNREIGVTVREELRDRTIQWELEE